MHTRNQADSCSATRGGAMMHYSSDVALCVAAAAGLRGLRVYTDGAGVLNASVMLSSMNMRLYAGTAVLVTLLYTPALDTVMVWRAKS